MEELKPCPYCGSESIKDCYVYIKCLLCLMEGPKKNKNDQYADYLDHKAAIESWNQLPRNVERAYCSGDNEVTISGPPGKTRRYKFDHKEWNEVK